MELVQKGHSLADIYGITKEMRDPLFALACRHIQSGASRKPATCSSTSTISNRSMSASSTRSL